MNAHLIGRAIDRREVESLVGTTIDVRVTFKNGKTGIRRARVLNLVPDGILVQRLSQDEWRHQPEIAVQIPNVVGCSGKKYRIQEVTK